MKKYNILQKNLQYKKQYYQTYMQFTNYLQTLFNR